MSLPHDETNFGIGTLAWIIISSSAQGRSHAVSGASTRINGESQCHRCGGGSWSRLCQGGRSVPPGSLLWQSNGTRDVHGGEPRYACADSGVDVCPDLVHRRRAEFYADHAPGNLWRG